MRPVTVVMLLVLAKHDCGVALIDDQYAVEQFPADAADEAFSDGVGPRRAHRCPDDAKVGGGEDGVEGGGESGVPVSDEEAKAAPGVLEVHEQVARQLG